VSACWRQSHPPSVIAIIRRMRQDAIMGPVCGLRHVTYDVMPPNCRSKYLGRLAELALHDARSVLTAIFGV